MKIWIISDLHCKYGLLNIPEDIDMVICAGDASTSRDPEVNQLEYIDFLEWFDCLPMQYKVLIAGNHDTAVGSGRIKTRYLKKPGRYYLNDETITVEGIKIFGSPWTPTFGYGWAFNCDRSGLHKHWDRIEPNTNIIITHGPPYSICDITQNNLQVGCKSLYTKVTEVEPDYCIFGHIHECAGQTLTIQPLKTKFINASVVDLRHNVVNNGHIINI